jgi:hypothetical protein
MLYNALGHTATVQHAHPNTEVIFLPPNTTFLIQLLDQGIIATSNSYYTRLTFSYILDTISFHLIYSVFQRSTKVDTELVIIITVCTVQNESRK